MKTVRFWQIAMASAVSVWLGALAGAATYFPGDSVAQFVPGPSPVSLPGYIKVRPYNDGFAAPNLWRIEATKLWRSLPVLSPDGSQYFFTEVLFLPGTRQVTSTLYTVDLPSLPTAANPPEDASGRQQTQPSGKKPLPPDPRMYTSWFDVGRAGKVRQVVWRAGDERPERFAFQVLVPVDWSADGRRILIKRQQGVQYTGLRTSDLIVADQDGRKLTLYGELARAVNYYWQQRGAQADVFRMAWDLQPLGWAPGSNEVFYFKAWAFSRASKPVFLGLWTFDLATHQPKLLSVNSEAQASVAANGYEVTIPSPLELERLTHSRYPSSAAGKHRFSVPAALRKMGQPFTGTSGQSNPASPGSSGLGSSGGGGDSGQDSSGSGSSGSNSSGSGSSGSGSSGSNSSGSGSSGSNSSGSGSSGSGSSGSGSSGSGSSGSGSSGSGSSGSGSSGSGSSGSGSSGSGSSGSSGSGSSGSSGSGSSGSGSSGSGSGSS